MARTRELRFHIRLLSAAVVALVVIASGLGYVKDTRRAEHMYVLVGTADIYGAPGYSVRLYMLSSARLALVRQVSASLFSVTDDLHGRLYGLDQNKLRLIMINESAPEKVDVVPALPRKGPDQGFDFYYPTWGALVLRGAIGACTATFSTRAPVGAIL